MLEDPPLKTLSVIVTAHNCAGFIQRTLQSAADAVAFLSKQEGTTVADAVEVVVVDDGSTDQTPQVVEDFLKGRANWQLVRREKASSPSCARNTGGRHSRGDILCFLDGDDLYLPEHLPVVPPRPLLTQTPTSSRPLSDLPTLSMLAGGRALSTVSSLTWRCGVAAMT